MRRASVTGADHRAGAAAGGVRCGRSTPRFLTSGTDYRPRTPRPGGICSVEPGLQIGTSRSLTAAASCGRCGDQHTRHCNAQCPSAHHATLSVKRDTQGGLGSISADRALCATGVETLADMRMMFGCSIHPGVGLANMAKVGGTNLLDSAPKVPERACLAVFCGLVDGADVGG